MFKRILLFFIVLVAANPLFAHAAPSAEELTVPASSAAFSTRTVQLSWFYKPPTDANLPVVQQNFHNYILTKNDEPKRDLLRSQGVTTPFLQYLRFEAIHDPGSCTAQPWRNQVADRIGDFCNIKAQHPDWFLRDSKGNMIVSETSSTRFVLMDPANAGWRAFWLERARQSQEQRGWDGVFLDNVEASLSKRVRYAAMPAAYPTDASYQAAIKGFLNFLYTTYFKPKARPLYANIIEVKDPAMWFNYLQALDGAMDEGWAVDWSSGYLSTERWLLHLRRAEKTQGLGKGIILVAQGDQSNAQRQQFAFGSYMLVAKGRASFRYTNDDAYGTPWVYGNYKLDLGEPLGARYLVNGLWKRDFTKGSVTVNPTTHTASFTTS